MGAARGGGMHISELAWFAFLPLYAVKKQRLKCPALLPSLYYDNAAPRGGGGEGGEDGGVLKTPNVWTHTLWKIITNWRWVNMLCFINM